MHVIKVNEIKEAVRKKPEDVRDEIERALATDQKANTAAQKQAEAFAAEAKKHEDLAAAVAAFKSDVPLSVENTVPMPQGRTFVPQLGAAKPLIAAVWKLTKDAPIPDQPIETDRAWVVPRLKERVEPDESQYDEKRKYIVFQLTREKQQRIVDAWFKELRKNAATDYDEIAVRYDDEAQAIRSARRNRGM